MTPQLTTAASRSKRRSARSYPVSQSRIGTNRAMDAIAGGARMRAILATALRSIRLCHTLDPLRRTPRGGPTDPMFATLLGGLPPPPLPDDAATGAVLEAVVGAQGGAGGRRPGADHRWPRARAGRCRGRVARDLASHSPGGQAGPDRAVLA